MVGISVMVLAVGLLAWMIVFFLKRNAEEATNTRGSALPSPQQGSRAAVEDPKAGSKRNWLIGVGGEVDGRHYHIGERIVTIGRKPANFIQITDRDSSRTHANLRPSVNGMLLHDLNSQNGTFVNGALVREANVVDGDSIRIGQARFVYRREANFATDDVQRQKQADSSMHDATAAGGNIQLVVARMMQECQGDTAEVARRLGVPEPSLKAMLRASGLGD
jgi:pSer/pThr/pTyr-binding forkhead associated (FHA) protein